MTRAWKRWTAIAGVAFVVLYVIAFTLGIEVGPTDREILEHYADSGSRSKEIAAFFVIAAAALCFVLFASGVCSLIARAEPGPRALTSVAWAGAVAYGVLALAGNAVSRAPAFAATDGDFVLDPNSRRLVEDAGLLLFASGTIAAMLLVVVTSIVSLRAAVLPRWLAWTGFPLAAVFPLAVSFVGFLALFLWVLAASAAVGFRRTV